MSSYWKSFFNPHALFSHARRIFSRKILCQEQETKNKSLIDEEIEIDDDIKPMLDNNVSEIEEKEIMKKELRKQETQPMVSFNKLSALFKNGIEDEKWNGLRFGLEFKPNQLLSLDYTLLYEKNSRMLNNFRISCMSFIPLDEKSQHGIMLVGRKEGEQALALQGHFILTDRDKISIISQNQKSDLNQAAYAFEYTHDFDRMNMSMKHSNYEPFMLSSVANVYKNIFIGCEAFKNPKSFYWVYNYALCCKAGPRNKLGFNLSYMSHMPSIGLDLNYRLSKFWNFFLTLSRNWNQGMISMGGRPYEAKITSAYTSSNMEVNVEVDYQGVMHCYSTYNVFKNIGLQLNLELNPLARWNKRNKKSIHSFGIGIKICTTPMEEVLQNLFNTDIEEGVDDYEYDKVLNENVK